MPVTEETNYRGKQILVGFQKDLTGNTLSKAIDISAFAETVEITDNFNTKEVNPTNNNGQNGGIVSGDAVFEGSITMDTVRALSPLFFASVYGKPSGFTFTAHSASAWTSTTAYTKGDVAAHSGGKFLVAQNTGTSGATEPTVTTESDYDDLAVDGDIVWKLRDNLYEGTGYATSFCTEKLVIIERAGEGCGSSNSFDRILEGVEFTYYTIQKDDGVIVSSQNISFMATKERRSSDADFTDVTVTATITPRADYFIAENVTFRVDGAKYGTLLNFELPYTRNVTMRTSTEPGERIRSVDKPTFTGSGTIKLDPAEYEVLRKIDSKAITITMDGIDGEKVDVTISDAQFHTPIINKEGSREYWMDFSINPKGSNSVYMATVNISTATNFN